LTVKVSLIGEGLINLLTTNNIWDSDKLYAYNIVTNIPVKNTFYNQTYEGFLKLEYTTMSGNQKNVTKNEILVDTKLIIQKPKIHLAKASEPIII
jgi:hypothetical protein